ncbi:hypothetical protein CAPTEDRAFT_111005 [Capitella teleta]|uniref:Sodium-coupled monocarboxylate transporter 1 n=1 Tax=Capitella teleta TaxID=283909 RepID=R7U100_CAPTE|nr:hypothetical protein CAPTEDRAFT_111005 [Capitella teleta]|eukprot:ELT99562.1 hypothetical protein CAPTEDRAFT_111005 [Capitella teleta]
MEEAASEKREFHWADYLVFALSLVGTAGVGLFLSLWKRKRSNQEELLLASRSMHFIPVCLSLLGSLLSSTLIMGGPADIHFYGAYAMPVIFAQFLTIPLAAFVIVPTFYKMNFTSAYQFLENRFNYTVRVTGSLVFSMSLLLNMAITLYAPALAFSEVTSLSLPMAVIVTGGICTLYTMIGGIKAVIWTDTIQMVIFFVGLVILAGVASSKVGGFGEVWQVAQDNGRDVFFDWRLDTRVRYTFWGQVIGQWTMYNSILFSNQMMIQRFMTVSSLTHAQISVSLLMLGGALATVMVAIIGWIMFAFYKIDPLISKQILKGDQIVALFFLDVLGSQHGLPGLLTAAVFASALSTVSSAVNSLAALTLEDFVKPAYRKVYKNPLTERMATILTISLALAFGAIAIGLSFAAEFMADKLIEATVIMWTIVGGPLAGVFIMGFFFPWVNSAGAFCGMLTSLSLSLWLGIGGMMYKIPTPVLPLRMGDHVITLPTFPPSYRPGFELVWCFAFRNYLPSDLYLCALSKVVENYNILTISFQWRFPRFLPDIVRVVWGLLHWSLSYCWQCRVSVDTSLQ